MSNCIMDCFVNDSLHLAQRYALIFVLGLYLFREQSSWKTVTGINDVQGQI